MASLQRKDLAVTYAAIDMLNSLMHSSSGDFNLKQEQLNKSSLLSSKSFLESLLNTWMEHVNLGSGALVLSSMLDFLTFALCVPYSETTDSKQFDALLEMVASRGRAMFKLFQVCSHLICPFFVVARWQNEKHFSFFHTMFVCSIHHWLL